MEFGIKTNNLKESCLKFRNPNFRTSDLASFLNRVEEVLPCLTKWHVTWKIFGDYIFH